MNAEALRSELVNLEKQLENATAEAAKYAEAAKQLRGAVGFCKGLIAKAETAASETRPATE